MPDSSRELAIKARDASRSLQALSSEARGNLLHQIADAIESETDKILQENEKDCQVSICILSVLSLRGCQIDMCIQSLVYACTSVRTVS